MLQPSTATPKTAHYVPVPVDIFDAAEIALGEAFNGTINQLDTWVKENLPFERLEEYYDCNRNGDRLHQEGIKVIWTAYLW